MNLLLRCTHREKKKVHCKPVWCVCHCCVILCQRFHFVEEMRGNEMRLKGTPNPRKAQSRTTGKKTPSCRTAEFLWVAFDFLGFASQFPFGIMLRSSVSCHHSRFSTTPLTSAARQRPCFPLCMHGDHSCTVLLRFSFPLFLHFLFAFRKRKLQRTQLTTDKADRHYSDNILSRKKPMKARMTSIIILAVHTSCTILETGSGVASAIYLRKIQFFSKRLFSTEF